MKSDTPSVAIQQDFSEIPAKKLGTSYHGNRNEKPYYRPYVIKLMSQGLCILCRKPNPAKTFHCADCTDKKVKTHRQKREQCAALGQCTECGEKWSGPTKRCARCRKRKLDEKK